MAAKRRVDWGEVGDLVLSILLTIDANRERFEGEARIRGITVEQLTAAAIAQAIQERVEGRQRFPQG